MEVFVYGCLVASLVALGLGIGGLVQKGIRLNRDNRWSIAYSEELISSKISATL
jgi:hypothetical protein